MRDGTVGVHYELTGPEQAPVVVLSNSLGTDLSFWDAQVPELAERFRVLRYDQRGHGGTPAPPGPYSFDGLGGDVLRMLDELELDRVHFAGLSMGGMTGMWLAQHAPERLDRLALLCTSAFTGPASWYDRAATVRSHGTASVAEGSLGRWFTPEFATRPEVVERFTSMVAGVEDEGYAGCCEALGSMDLRPGLPAIAASTLVVAGADDPATPPSHGELIAEGIPDARLTVLAGASHLANVERPDTVTELLVEHFS